MLHISFLPLCCPSFSLILIWARSSSISLWHFYLLPTVHPSIHPSCITLLRIYSVPLFSHPYLRMVTNACDSHSDDDKISLSLTLWTQLSEYVHYVSRSRNLFTRIKYFHICTDSLNRFRLTTVFTSEIHLICEFEWIVYE